VKRSKPLIDAGMLIKFGKPEFYPDRQYVVCMNNWKPLNWAEGQPLLSVTSTMYFDHDTLRGVEIVHALTGGTRRGCEQLHHPTL
jgi:hypothetical protein